MMPKFTTLNDFFSGSFTLSNTQSVSSKVTAEKKPKYLLIMDLDDKDSELRDAKKVLSDLENELSILAKWGFGREIPSELERSIQEAKSNCEKIEKEVTELEYSIYLIEKEIEYEKTA